MALSKPVGRNASSKKYDLLSALAVHGLSLDKQKQRLVLRLIALITTRYNWASNELTMGQKEIARLWSVDARTVKREMAKLRALEWVTLKHQGARGRVATHQISFEKILGDTRSSWDKVGPDFSERVGGMIEMVPRSKILQVDFGAKIAMPKAQDETWGDLCKALYANDPQKFDNWYARLEFIAKENGSLVVRAPSRFVAQYVETHLAGELLKHAAGVYDQIDKLIVEC